MVDVGMLLRYVDMWLWLMCVLLRFVDVMWICGYG